MKFTLIILTALLMIAGLVFGVYVNILWLVDTLINLVDHIRNSSSSAVIAWDITKIACRTITMLVVMLLCQIPALICGICAVKAKE